MPHIHTEPGQHDMTVSAYIILDEDQKCLVHFHKRVERLMQVGGHIELNETPWQAITHELHEEAGYTLDELEIVQFSRHGIEISEGAANIMHPVPFAMNTHNVGNDHYHSDMSFGFVARSLPENTVHDGESTDLRWLTLEELEESASIGETLVDVKDAYSYLLRLLPNMTRKPANTFSLQKPENLGVVYKTGAVER